MRCKRGFLKQLSITFILPNADSPLPKAALLAITINMQFFLQDNTWLQWSAGILALALTRQDRRGRVPGHSALGVWVSLPPCTIEQFHLGKSFADHSGKEESKQHTANQHIVIVILEYIKLFRGVHASLVDVQTICHHLLREKSAASSSTSAERLLVVFGS